MEPSRRVLLAGVGAGLPIGSIPMPAQARTSRDIDVRDFGAKGDGLADDAPAINSAIHSLRSAQTRIGSFGVAPRLVFSVGVFRVAQTIDLTQLQDINLVVDGRGSVILGQCAGQPVIDALGSRWLTMRDLTIVGDEAATPKLGLQVGRTAGRLVADDHRFENVKIVGHYGLACLVNAAAETTGFDHVLLWNDHPSADSYCLIQDGLNHFGAASAFAGGGPSARDQDDSFNENEFINCDFRHGGGGTPVWLGDTARHSFIRCYVAARGAAAFIVHSGPNGHQMLDVDCHCETAGLQSAFLFTGSSTRPVLRGFSYKDHWTCAERSVFRCGTGMEKITLQNARIEIAGYYSESCQMFDDPTRWAVTGSVYSSDPKPWNGAGCFSGSLLLADRFSIIELAAPGN